MLWFVHLDRVFRWLALAIAALRELLLSLVFRQALLNCLDHMKNTAFLPGFDVLDGIDLTDIVVTPRACGDEVSRTPAENPAPPSMTIAQFRARQLACLLSPAERAAVATRARFHTIFWIRLARQDTDELP